MISFGCKKISSLSYIIELESTCFLLLTHIFYLNKEKVNVKEVCEFYVFLFILSAIYELMQFPDGLSCFHICSWFVTDIVNCIYLLWSDRCTVPTVVTSFLQVIESN